MSGSDIKKPETREVFVKMLTDAAKKEVGSKGKASKPTVIGTAKKLDIHMDKLLFMAKGIQCRFQRKRRPYADNR